jgi:hypothetical protein
MLLSGVGSCSPATIRLRVLGGFTIEFSTSCLPVFWEEKRVEAGSTLFSSKNLTKEVVSSMWIY